MKKKKTSLPCTSLLGEVVNTPLGAMSIVEAAEAAVAFEAIGASNMASMFRELLRTHFTGKGGTRRCLPESDLDLQSCD